MTETVMGVDAALGMTGICVMTRDFKEILELTKIRTAKLKATPTESSRLLQIHNEFSALLNEFQPSIVVMENQHSDRRNPKTGLGLSRVRGIIQTLCAMRGIEFYLYEPGEIKRTVTGKGRADKEEVQRAVLELYQEHEIVREKLSVFIPDGKNKTDDMADALALLHTYRNIPEFAELA